MKDNNNKNEESFASKLGAFGRVYDRIQEAPTKEAKQFIINHLNEEDKTLYNIHKSRHDFVNKAKNESRPAAPVLDAEEVEREKDLQQFVTNLRQTRIDTQNEAAWKVRSREGNGYIDNSNRGFTKGHEPWINQEGDVKVAADAPIGTPIYLGKDKAGKDQWVRKQTGSKKIV